MELNWQLIFIALGLAFERLGGVTALGAFGAFAVFLGMVAGVVGISLLSLGYSFNYFVALFHKRPVRQGIFAPCIGVFAW